MNATSSDRNLLFGLLALQLDFLTPQHLIEAVQAWMPQKQTPLDELLVRRGTLDEDDRAAVERVVKRHVQRHGDARASLAAALIPDELRASLTALGDADLQVGLMAETLPPSASANPLPPTILPAPTQTATTSLPRASGPATAARAPSPVRYARIRPHARHAAADAARPLPEREKRARDHGTDAIALLKRVEAAGGFSNPRNRELLSKDEDLAWLRQRDDFRAFVAGLKDK